jgi:hypothetical protein
MLRFSCAPSTRKIYTQQVVIAIATRLSYDIATEYALNEPPCLPLSSIERGDRRDEVGLAKTIEAGILLSQRWAERKRKILIIVPSSLWKEWHQELSDKFFLRCVLLETKTFDEQIRPGNLNPFDRSEIVVCSYQFARSQEPYVLSAATSTPFPAPEILRIRDSLF